MSEEEKERLDELEKEIRSEIQNLKKDINKTLQSSKSTMEDLLKTKEGSKIPLITAEKNSFLDFFGNAPTIKKLDINLEKSNLIKSIAPFLKEVNLQAIFLYVSILKMLNVDISESFIQQAFKTMEKQTHQKIFTSPYDEKPDTINIFYGLATVLELIQYGNVDFIDLPKITNYIQKEVKYFDAIELHKNYYLLNCFNMLIRLNQNITINRQTILEEISKLDLSALPEPDPIRDLYEAVSCIILINPNDISENIKSKYYNILMNFLNNHEISDLTITELAQASLIIDLLGLKEDAEDLIEKLLKKIKDKTIFFNTKEIEEDFSWESDKLALLVELRMLFYSLLVNLQYDLL
ncbi:MAG: hypothetical protein EU547_02290 [Promethearchaeota archaeon]|nr:MAG: hypothetical protein EU547_02290 [Candidatus Lokiarchaeota archaeon]